MSIADTLKDIAEEVAVKALAEGAKALVDKFREEDPSTAAALQAAMALAQQAADLLPEEDLYAHLSDDDAAAAIALARMLKAVKLQGQ